MTVDLHIHTTCSDGLRTPEQTVEEAIRKGMRAIAITDHDITAGIDAAQKFALTCGSEGNSLEIISGVEINCYDDHEETHVLGYWIDVQSEVLQTKLAQIRIAREERVAKIIAKLQALRYEITYEQIYNMAHPGSIGRPHIARFLVRKGYFRSTAEAFDKLLSEGGKAYVERYKTSPVEAIQVILQAGGLPVIAHPGIYKQEVQWQRLIDHGLFGVEVYHTKHDFQDIKKYEAIAEHYQLLKTGGSDCHGIGSSSLLGTVDVPSDVVEHLKKRRFGGQLL